MKKTATILVSAFLIISCQDKKKENNEQNDWKKVDAEYNKRAENAELAVAENSVFTLNSTFTVTNFEEPITTKDSTEPKKLDAKTLGLPIDFINRAFLTNGTGYKKNLDKLVGTVVKKTTVGETSTFEVARNYKFDSVKLSAGTPDNGVLVEKKYDSGASAEVKYLFASVTGEANKAFYLLINDVNEILIDDNQIDIKKLYDTYHNDNELSNYYIVKAAVVTSIYTKEYTKMSTKGGYNAGAIKVEGKYYSEDSDIRQDWKIGMQLISLKEFLKGFDGKPTTPPSNPTPATPAPSGK